MPPIRRRGALPLVLPLLPSIADPPVGADVIALRSTTIEILQALRNRGIIAIPSSTYYGVLQDFSPWQLLKLEDTDINARNSSGAIVGAYSGSYLQQQASTLSNMTGFSTRFNSGAITLFEQITAPANYTLICRFIATSTATGGFFGFSNLDSPNNGTLFDRMLRLDSQGRINLYNYNGSETNLTTDGSYRDGQPHTLIARMGAGRTTAIFIDGMKVAETATTGAWNYSGWWKVGWSSIVGPANGITMQGAAIIHSALTDAQIATIHSAV